MNLRQALNTARLVLGQRTDTDTLMKEQMTLAQEHFEKGPTFPWFLLSEFVTTTTTIDGWRLPFPEDFIEEYEEGALYYADSEGEYHELEKGQLDDLIAYFGVLETGEPLGYSVDGSYIRLFPPKPDAEYTIKMLYYKKDTRVDQIGDTETCQWLTYAPNVLIGYAGAMVATGLRDSVAMSKFEKMEGAGRVLLNNQNEGKKHVNRIYQIGGPT